MEQLFHQHKSEEELIHHGCQNFDADCFQYSEFTNPGISDFLSQWPTRLNLWEVLVLNKKNIEK